MLHVETVENKFFCESTFFSKFIAKSYYVEKLFPNHFIKNIQQYLVFQINCTVDYIAIVNNMILFLYILIQIKVF